MWKWSDLRRFLKRSPQKDTADLGAIMWPVAYPNPQDPTGGTAYIPRDPHITVVIFNDINNPELGFTREDVMDAVRESMHEVLLWCKVEGLEWFGEDQNVPVLRVHHDYLYTYHKSIMGILAARGIPVDTTFPDYKPHITIPEAAALEGFWPEKVMAGPVEVWWSNERYKVDDES